MFRAENPTLDLYRLPVVLFSALVVLPSHLQCGESPEGADRIGMIRPENSAPYFKGALQMRFCLGIQSEIGVGRPNRLPERRLDQRLLLKLAHYPRRGAIESRANLQFRVWPR